MALRDRSLIMGRRGTECEGGGGQVKFYLCKKGGGGERALAMLKGGGGTTDFEVVLEWDSLSVTYAEGMRGA